MYRFRRRSDAKQSQVPDILQPSNEFLSELPPASNFRTSLILPDLTRRFTLLRTSSGDPVPLDDLRARFADQRARGSENQILEEEEDMILETLGRIRAKNALGNAKGGEGSSAVQGSAPLDRRGSMARSSNKSSSTTPPPPPPPLGSVPSSPAGRSNKRYSNNLFGSGRFRDYTYVRSVVSQKPGSSRSVVSLTPTDVFTDGGNTSSYSDSIRPVTPDNSATSYAVHSSPSEKGAARSAPLLAPAPYPESSTSAAEYRLSKTLGPSALKRTSLALEQAIKEIEEEAEDQIVMPRFSRLPNSEPVGSSIDTSSGEFEAGTAISSDKQLPIDPEATRISPVPYGRPGTASPTPRLPGYIPGMPRPMTPRDAAEDDRSHSTTPRATSPILPLSSDHPSPTNHSNLASGIFRRDSHPPRQSPRPNSPSTSSPLFLPRSPNGRFSPEERTGENSSVEFDIPANSSLLSTRRPASPLSATAYQPMAVSSRPGTPSNVIWNTPIATDTQSTREQTDHTPSHRRDPSWVSENSINLEVHETLERTKSAKPSLRSPTRPESPLIDRGDGNKTTPKWDTADIPIPSDNQPSSAISGFELGSPTINRALRSPTPTQNVTRPPASPTFSDKSSNLNGSRPTSKQNGHSSPFTLGSLHPLVFSPIANSSRSSLESAGSSYHSWDGEHQKDRSLIMFSDVDPSQGVWHDVSSIEKSSSATLGSSQDDGWEVEDIIARFAGLTKSDFVAIQEKLVGAVMAKAATPDVHNRAPSLRRRRPSTSQSNYSLNGREPRVASPPPQTQNPIGPASLRNPDNSSKASALLDSVVDSIHLSHNLTAGALNKESSLPSESKIDMSPSTQRNRDLARAIFGAQDRQGLPSKHFTSTGTSDPRIAVEQTPNTIPVETSPRPDEVVSSAKPTGPLSPSAFSSPLQLHHDLHTPKSPQTVADHVELAKEVQRKTDAAMLALRKSPSNPKLPDALSPATPVSRKRISPNQISTPRLMSASTSVDTIPLRSPSVGSGNLQGASRIGQRIKRLRGSLRAKTPVHNEEITPYPLDLRSPPPAQNVFYDPSTRSAPNGSGPASATELGGFKVSVPSPPASAGPGLRGFMARFRKQRVAGVSPENDGRGSPHTITPPRRPPASPQATIITTASEPAPPPTSNPSSPKQSYLETPMVDALEMPKGNNGASAVDDASALRQLFAAASNLGVDQAALNDLLHRSTSKSARTTTPMRPNSTVNNAAPDESHSAHSPSAPSERSIKREHPGQPDDTLLRKVSKRVDRKRRDDHVDGAAMNTVVRRTIIYPSETRSSTIDLNILVRKNSQSSRRHRPTSGVSISSRSVHDRAPTPPPPRSPVGRRFSTDVSPPVPQLPSSLSSQAENLLHASQASADGPIEKSSSTYDSLYEMYAGENKAVNTNIHDSNKPDNNTDNRNSDTGPAVEVIELANGETIWSIVNGLRDDDAESAWGSRGSFASENSLRQNNGESVQVLFKGHARTPSKSSTSSVLPQKRGSQIQGNSPPETKVFYSSSAQIGRLIENISQGMEAGSFNFKPARRSGHSHSSSFQSDVDSSWTVEETLEHMLGSMGST